jgi:AraC-like DNA-binding protein
VSDTLYTVILLGALQGIVTGCLMFFAKPHRKADKFLAIAIWLMALASLNVYLNYTGWYYSNTAIAIIHAVVPMVIIMPIGPLIYFYMRLYFEQDFKLPENYRIHFLPAIIDFIPSLTAIAYLVLVATGLIKPNPQSWGSFIDQYNVYSDIPRWLSLTVYILLSLKNLHLLKKKEKRQASQIKWLRQFVYVFLFFQIIWLAYLVPYIIPGNTDGMLSTMGWLTVYVPMAVIIYWLGIKGYIIHLHRNMQKKKANSNGLLTPETVQSTILSLQKSMEEDKVYLNPDLDLALLSMHIGITQKIISAVLNQYMQKSFADFVNECRVEAVKKKLLQPEMEHLTIAGIASECGFSSKASFQRIFKDHTGSSPSEFQKAFARND